jgi:hypothetical protein
VHTMNEQATDHLPVLIRIPTYQCPFIFAHLSRASEHALPPALVCALRDLLEFSRRSGPVEEGRNLLGVSRSVDTPLM